MSLTFQRNKENFTCEMCGFFVMGNGYTNHCPQCLWSKHVDICPGDRSSECKGVMEPISIQMKSGSLIITHRCTLCGHEKNNKKSSEDSFDSITSVLHYQ